MPTNSAVREILPPKRLIWAHEIFALEHFAGFAQRQTHQMLASVAVRHRRNHRADVLRQHRGGDLGVRSPPARIISRSTLLRSCRTFPGQSCDCSTASASAPTLRLGRPVNLRYLRHEILDQLGHILAALGQRRDADRHHREPMIKVFADFPAAISARCCGWWKIQCARRQSLWYCRRHAETSDSTSTRRILFCVSRGMSAISSINNVPAMSLFERADFAGLRCRCRLQRRTARSPSAQA